MYLYNVYVPYRALPRMQHACPELTKNQNIVTLPWPARSPDLAPTEHVLDILGRNAKCHNDVRTRPQMTTALRREWAAIAQNDIRTIIGLVRRRCTACIRVGGDHTSI